MFKEASILRSLFRTAEPKQNYRLKRTLLAFAFYNLCGAVMVLCAWFGKFPWLVLATYTAGFFVVSLVFFAIIRSGWNMRFHDPSLTEPQIVCAHLLCTYTLVHAGQLRGVFIFAYVVALMFGGIRLSTLQLARLVIFIILLFPTAAFFASRLYPDSFDSRIEIISWISMCVILAFVVMLIDNLTRLNQRVKTSNAELQVALTKLTDLSVHDELTGLYNRRYLGDMLGREKNRIDRHSSDMFCVCMFDIDHFKHVNDTFGHNGGDVVLSEFAKLAGEYIRTTDILARWGGEEFLLFLPHTLSDRGEQCVERIRAALAQTSFKDFPPDFRVTISVGIAEYRSGETIDQLIDRADHALYHAKNSGRNRVEHAPPVAECALQTE